MVLPKSTVHLSRFAGTALKSFTHGYAQTVVAASQSSYASQNTPVAPLASNFLSRLNKSNKSQDQQAHYGTAHPQTTAGGASLKQDLAHPDSGLVQYYDAWHKLQKSDAKEWQQFQFAKRIGWQAPSVVPQSESEQPGLEEVENSLQDTIRPSGGEALKRSYSTSAVNDFSQAIDNEVAEAVAFAQVNEAISEEVERSRQDAERAASESQSVSQSGTAVSQEGGRSRSTPATSASSLDLHTAQLNELLQSQQYGQIPAAFEAMLRAGVAQPSPLAYRALLASAIKLTKNKHQQVPRVLEVYSDMLRRKVLPDVETYTSLLNVLSGHALDSAIKQKQMLQTRSRFALPDAPDSFMFRSDNLEYTLLAQDQSLSISLRVLDAAHASTSLPTNIYETLIFACAERGLLVDMMQLYGTMESQRLLPQATIFPAMIEAFAAVGDLRNAVECYNEYKALAIANDEGINSITRMDDKVYAALIKAYGVCDRQAAAQRFLDHVQTEQPTAAKRQLLLDTVSTNALIPLQIRAGNFEQVSAVANALSEPAFPVALDLISKSAADQGNMVEGTKAFSALVNTGADHSESAAALLAMHVRTNTVEAAEPYWRALESSRPSLNLLEPTIMRAVALIELGQVLRALRSARAMFGRVREFANAADLRSEEVVDRIDESIELLAKRVINASPLQPEASTELLRMMVDNGSLLGHFAEDTLASLGAGQILHLAPADLDLFTQLQARMILDESPRDVAGPARFAMLLDTIVSNSILPDVNTENLIEKTLINLNRNDLSRLWNNYRYPTAVGFTPAFAPMTPFLPPPPPQPTYEETIDPYAAQTDNKGSVAITDLLERGHGRPLSVLNEAMNKFRNIRRTGRHPRFFAYSKLISAAAKENRFETCKEILEMAKQDVPFSPIYRVVRHGWFSIVDSMLAACLTLGRRDMAAKYHQDLLELGSAPSSNTYGLYITTLKENTRTSDEASEAVKIFLRSKAEGVEPTSFLYNALIGKLGKARRIDDCLFYFAEMRNLGVRPTSVTYGTIVNALCRVSDEKFAEEIFEEMEGCSNYKPRPAPYHSLMQYFLTTKRDRSKVLAYFERMQLRGIEPTMHTYKLLIDAHATLSPIDMDAAEAVLARMRESGVQAEAVHYASLIHAKGCVLHDLIGARALFDSVVNNDKIRLQACVYQAMFESLVANRHIAEADTLLFHMREHNIELTPYIANALIHGWTQEKNVQKAREAFELVDFKHREPSTYESMVRAHMAVEDRDGAQAVVVEALSRGYPAAVAGKIAELVGGGRT